ncbi:META domain-containing protein [Colwellia sp. D2M02]|uniref:DUF306 domain-containing protein n=1 Tax=Colwellia asteriadis TaxID=517723 RepID=A0ABN1L970_9GAMM|nr:META domain-containing protein [Colwellia sp. D2M02]MBU2893863.1 META domain-containing protein [Colwellia sp. D2M02]
MKKNNQYSLLLTLFTCASLASCSDNATNKTTQATEQVQPSQTSASVTSNGTQENSAQELIGSWTIEYISERPVIDNSPAQFIFLPDNKIAGSASCNNISGTYTLNTDNKSLTFSPMAMTRKMCPEALMEQEQRFTAQLTDINQYRITDGILYLTDEHQTVLFKASRINK